MISDEEIKVIKCNYRVAHEIDVHAIWRAWDSHHGTISRSQGLNWDTWYQISEMSGTVIGRAWSSDSITFGKKIWNVENPIYFVLTLGWLVMRLTISRNKSCLILIKRPKATLMCVKWMGHDLGHWYQNQMENCGTLISNISRCPL